MRFYAGSKLHYEEEADVAAKVWSQISNYQHHLELVKNANFGPGGHRPTESETLGVGLSNLCLNKSSRRF